MFEGATFLQVGDYNTQQVQFELGPLRPVEEVPPTAGPVGVPIHVPLFVGRESELAALEQALATGPGAVVQAVHGLGGIGKSTLAARYASLQANRYTQVVWITAEDSAGVEAGLGQFALALEPHLSRGPTQAALTPKALADRAISWLAAHQGWLLVLDNVTSPTDIRTLLGALSGADGSFLATSRRANIWRQIGAREVRLDVLQPDEALTLLASTIGTTFESLDGGARLCAELGHLPLALTQAGAYIAQNLPAGEPTAHAYLRLLAEHPRRMYATGDEDTSSDQVIAQTWNITLDKLAENPLAGLILRVLAWYAPDQIPVSLLTPMGSEPDVVEAIGKLAAYNMLDRDASGRYLKVHRLVQAVARTPDIVYPRHRDPVLIADARDRATFLLNSAAPDPSNWLTWRRFIGHVNALADNTLRDMEEDTDAMASLLQRAMFYLSEESTPVEEEQAAVRDAMLAYIDRAVTAYERILGPHDRKTLVARRWRAWFFEETDALRELSAVLERALGADDPDYLVSVHDQAWRHLHSEDFETAEILFARAEASQKHVSDERRNELFATQYGLGFCLFRQKRFSEAEAVLADCVRGRTAGLSPQHPHTLITKRLLGVTYVYLEGRADDALQVLRETLEEQQRVFRKGHSEIEETHGWLPRAEAEQEVTALRQRSAVAPGAHESDFAAALLHLAFQRMRSGWWPDEALAPAKEAVEIHRKLVADDPASHGGGLATALHIWALARFGARKDSSGALQSTGEAVNICRKLVADAPEQFLPLLRDVLGLQADLLIKVGRFKEARIIRDWLVDKNLDGIGGQSGSPAQP